MKKNLNIDRSLSERAQPAILALEFDVKVDRTKDSSIWEEISQRERELKNIFSATSYNEDPVLSEIANVCQDFGVKVSRYPFSSWALVKRLMRGKALYQINNVVDLGNLISLKTLLPVGSYDVDKIEGEISFRLGENDEQMETLAKGEMSMEGVPLFADELGGFGSIISDSPRTMIQDSTRRVIMIVISLMGKERLLINSGSIISDIKRHLSTDVEVDLYDSLNANNDA